MDVDEEEDNEDNAHDDHDYGYAKLQPTSGMMEQTSPSKPKESTTPDRASMLGLAVTGVLQFVSFG